eukprot:CAMPEP_0197664452 /NCGR_PEP_ID=MMETSP1338-20131121/58639_1 /TAXON_ID=43686 ORGANISM="Pelagodinium beii, Strain RCC1491" /NCGR_SAMPLE_ID=MMETSP1338 /ASSEMBLY_ACC=CAM_ASM_000754 /LENGTH=630 /DNA_ID=CAMNT_0043243087 /DNA_START=79 /DNA_END=1971 /DNA_ORIENTATION=-
MPTPRSARANIAVPFLPGNTVHEMKVNTARPHTLVYGIGGPSVTPLKQTGSLISEKSQIPKLDFSVAVLDKLSDPFHRFNMSARATTFDEKQDMKLSARNTYRPAIEPAWLKHDRQVLRFNAYFQEPVHENPKESHRIRACTILFYLEDGTMMVSEPKIENSGIPQGTFVKRHRIPKQNDPKGSFFSYEDLRVGMTISLYSRSFRIVSCDEFTRSFYYQMMGEVMEEDQEPPVDSFHAEQLEETSVPSDRSAILADFREYSKVALGGARKNEKLQQYMENDRKVLRFHCYWDDSTKYGTRMYYTLHYYLADDTIEILENISRNAGRDPYPVFWKRSSLRKNPFVSPVPGMVEPAADIYRPEDLVVGEVIDVMGRSIFLYDCDDFTRDFFQQYSGYEQASIKIDHPKLVHVKLSYPPHNGFGSEEDSLANCKRLTPRPPPRDMKKFMTDGDKVLRFEASMSNGLPSDGVRRFVVAISAADEHVSVWELKQRNSGYSEGKFASKSKKQNPATAKPFKLQDFYVGAVVEVSAVPFYLLAADEAALIYMEENKRDFPYSNAALVASKLLDMRETLRQADGLVGCMDLQELAQDQFGIQLVSHELITLARAYGVHIDLPLERMSVDTRALLVAIR